MAIGESGPEDQTLTYELLPVIPNRSRVGLTSGGCLCPRAQFRPAQSTMLQFLRRLSNVVSKDLHVLCLMRMLRTPFPDIVYIAVGNTRQLSTHCLCHCRRNVLSSVHAMNGHRRVLSQGILLTRKNAIRADSPVETTDPAQHPGLLLGTVTNQLRNVLSDVCTVTKAQAL